ncbi:ABC transporter substrate-binding protein [Candidatus Riflebacteria bacterium]
MKVFFSLLFLLFFSCFYTRASELKKGGTLVFALARNFDNLDPAKTIDSEAISVCANIFDGLVRYGKNSTVIEPALATHWQSSDRGKRWIFHLRQGVYFHDGTLFDAAAVVFSFKRQLSSSAAADGDEFIYWKSMFSMVKDVRALDEATVEISLRQAHMPFLTNLAMVNMSIMSPIASKKYGRNIGKNPVGTGPFMFHKWIPDEKIILKASSSCWAGNPYIDQLNFLPIPGPERRFARLLAGQLEGISAPGAHELKAVRSGAAANGLQLVSIPGMNLGYLALNNMRPPLDDERVRKAIAMCINRKLLVQILFSGLAVVATNPFPPTIWGFNAEIGAYPYDPQKALELLEQAGLSNGFSMTLYAMPVSRPYMLRPRQIAMAIQGFLKKIKIDARIITFEWDEYLERTENGEHDACLTGWVGENGDPDNFLFPLFAGVNAKKGSATNLSFYSNETLNDILLHARKEINPIFRQRHYLKAQEIIHASTPIVPLAHARDIILLKKTVRNFQQHPTGRLLFHKVWLDE